jgi:hypothetical protein
MQRDTHWRDDSGHPLPDPYTDPDAAREAAERMPLESMQDDDAQRRLICRRCGRDITDYPLVYRDWDEDEREEYHECVSHHEAKGESWHHR